MKWVCNPQALSKKVRDLNTYHDLDNGDHGYLQLRRGRGTGGKIHYRVYCRMRAGEVAITGWKPAAEIMEDLKEKDWRQVLRVANGAARYLPVQ